MNCICGHPQHPGIVAAPITKERAAEVWHASSIDKLPFTAAECETVMQVWDRMSGSSAYADAAHAIRQHGSAAALARLTPVNPGPLQPRTLVTCEYRGDSIGRVLAIDDPRAWAGSLAFPESNPDPENVRAHVKRVRAQGLLDEKLPVLWQFKSGEHLYWDSQLTPVAMPFSVGQRVRFVSKQRAARSCPGGAWYNDLDELMALTYLVTEVGVSRMTLAPCVALDGQEHGWNDAFGVLCDALALAECSP